MLFSGDIFYSIFAFSYKTLAGEKGLPESLITEAGSAAAIAQSLSRLASGILYDLFGVKIVYLCIIVIPIVNSLICYWALDI